MSDRFMDNRVLIVGGGPVGLLSAILLSRQGVPSIIVERRAGPGAAPKAHALNPRSLEICRAAGINLARIYALRTPPEESKTVRFVSRMVGVELGSLTYERQDEAVKSLTPTPLINIAQPDLEHLLVEIVRGDPATEIRYRHEWRECRQADGIVTSTIADADGVYESRHPLVIGCDGAGSPVREKLGIAMQGGAGFVNTVNIHFSADLRRLVGDRPAILYWILDPAASGNFIVYDLGSNIVFSHRYDPGQVSAESFTPDRCREIVEAAVGAPLPDIVVHRASPWLMTAQVAEHYRDGGIFLAGDAAHRFPPTGGLGLNTGIGDAQNLAWKIGAVFNGWASNAVLETYESERRPVALANSEQSLVNAELLIPLLQLVGSVPGSADTRPFSEQIADPAFRDAVRRCVDAQREHFDSLALQLGYIYGEPDLRPVDVSNYVPSFRPGARMPHAWVHSADHGISTLDLLSDTSFTLIVGTADAAWTQAAQSVGIPVTIRRLGTDFKDLIGDWSARSGIASGGVLFVRPDGHIALQADDATDATGRLRSAAARFAVSGEGALA